MTEMEYIKQLEERIEKLDIYYEDLVVFMESTSTYHLPVKRFFTDEDQEKGYIEVENRKGILEQFQLTSISIGVVVAEKGRFANILLLQTAPTFP